MKYLKKLRSGFTLVEVMIGMTLLAIFMTGIISAIRLSSILAESAIFEISANTVAQGYLEQVKNLPYREILLAVQDPDNFELATIAPVHDASTGTTVVEDPISLLPSAQPIVRNVLIDTRNDGDGPQVFMPFRFWITIDDLNVGTDPVNALEIIIVYEFQMPAVLGGNWVQRQVQAIRARV